MNFWYLRKKNPAASACEFCNSLNSLRQNKLKDLSWLSKLINKDENYATIFYTYKVKIIHKMNEKSY